MLLNFIRNPKAIGTVLPSSRFLARAVANYVPIESSVLELGAGTGAVTMELIKRGFTTDRLFICEYDEDLYDVLKSQFFGYPIFCEDACLAHTFMKPQSMDVVISGLPLRNFPKSFRYALIESLRKVLKPGGSIIQFTYGFSSPLPFLKGSRQEYVIANFPPAFVWQYWLD